MQRKNIVLALFLSLIYACATTHSAENLNLLLKIEYKLAPNGVINEADDIEQDICLCGINDPLFIGLKPEDILKILGNPTAKNENELIYTCVAKVHDKEESFATLRFELRNQKVVDIYRKSNKNQGRPKMTFLQKIPFIILEKGVIGHSEDRDANICGNFYPTGYYIGLKRRDIVKLLGEPAKYEKNKMTYYCSNSATDSREIVAGLNFYLLFGVVTKVRHFIVN